MLALHLDCSTTALTTPQKVLPIWNPVELKVLDFSDGIRTGITIFNLETRIDPGKKGGASSFDLFRA